jgi:hypothetical protein
VGFEEGGVGVEVYCERGEKEEVGEASDEPRRTEEVEGLEEVGVR